MAKNRRRSVMQDEESENFWPSFADLTSTIALIFFVLVLLAYIQNLIAGKQLQSVRGELQTSMRNLSAAKNKVSSSEQRLKLLASQIEVGQAELRLSADKLTTQEETIANSNRELGVLRARLQGIAVLRLDVLEKVKKSIEAQLAPSALASSTPVQIGDNGNILINESLVFESNDFRIKQKAKPLLDTLANAFANVLADASVRENIDVILVQGHTDERGSVAYNRELSAKRANAVLDHMFAANPTLEGSFGSYFASSAYSEFRPLKSEKNEQAYEQNRRIEVSVVLRDASVRGLIDEYMRGVEPAVQGTSAPAAPSSP
jgi:chemotaxis protein MotB